MAIPTPFLVGRINCYLIEDEPLTLVDTGPNSGKSLDELEQAFAHHGHAIEDLELIVLTHQHMDHVGLVEILQRRSGAEVAGFELLAPYLEDFPASANADDKFAERLMRSHGIPADLVSVLEAVGAAFRAFGSSGQISRRLRDGDTLELRDRSFKVLHRPGHSASDLVFWDEQRRLMLGGDHLLPHISSNALVSRQLTGDPERPRPLITYIESMRATRELPAELTLPGHGDPFGDHVALIDKRLKMHDRRARKMLRMLEPGPLSAYEVALQLFGDIALTQAYLTLSEVLGHIDLLVADGRAREVHHGELIRYEAV
jgi:glyoxylase-like metal-dependent hydrolase (beta-lactamase superfamily II)